MEMCEQNVKKVCTETDKSDTMEKFDEQWFFWFFQFLAEWYVYPTESADRLLARILKALSVSKKITNCG
ncbi:MAG: hypothetical protein LIO96_04510 [Lachnospiraceae bacterium]|nr:hypothetical protein [Lachnospiraceae bacterium]